MGVKAWESPAMTRILCTYTRSSSVNRSKYDLHRPVRISKSRFAATNHIYSNWYFSDDASRYLCRTVNPLGACVFASQFGCSGGLSDEFSDHFLCGENGFGKKNIFMSVLSCSKFFVFVWVKSNFLGRFFCMKGKFCCIFLW